jgi:RIO kinase 1
VRVPESLTALFDYGVLEEVVRPLMSGKEAHVYLVVSGGRYAVAKIYKEAENRSFKHRAEYTEGRKVRNTRDQRAIANRSKHGRQKDEAAWRSTEVDMIHRLHAAGVRVPVPYHFIDGVLLMELVTDAEGDPAPRLGDLPFDASSARAMYDRLIRAVIQMLCAGVVHGDLSEFNVLAGADGPVLIDFPQSIDSAHNTNARKLLLRDVDNLHRFLARHVPSARRFPLAEEMWNLYEQNLLTPETRLRGDYRAPERRANTASVLDIIDDANRDERKRREALGLSGGPSEPGHRSRAPQQQGRGPAPKKEPAVYQGLANEGLKFFRHLRDPEPRGAPRNGSHPQGQRPQGQQSQGQRSQGQRPQGQHAQGQRPQGQHAQGQRPQGQQQGQRPQGQPQGQRPQGQHSQGQRPQGQHPQGQRPQGQQQGQRPQGQPQGQRPQGQHPQGQRPQGQHSHGGRNDSRRHRSPASPVGPHQGRETPATEPPAAQGQVERSSTTKSE